MIKIALLIICFGLSTLTTLFLNFDSAWKIALGIVGFGIAYVILAVVIFFIIAIIFTCGIKKDEIATKYGAKTRKILNSFFHVGMSLFGIKITITGMEKMPTNTNFVLLQNHCSNLDPMISDVVFKKYPLIFVSKESLFHIPFFGKFLSRIGYVKLKRTACIEDIKEIDRGIRFVKENQCSLAIYPEGTRNKTYPYPPLLDFKEGTFAMLKKCERPIVVTVIHGTSLVNDLLLLKIHKVKLDIIKVIEPSEYQNMSIEDLSKMVHKMMLDNLK